MLGMLGKKGRDEGEDEGASWGTLWEGAGLEVSRRSSQTGKKVSEARRRQEPGLLVGLSFEGT